MKKACLVSLLAVTLLLFLSLGVSCSNGSPSPKPPDNTTITSEIKVVEREITLYIGGTYQLNPTTNEESAGSFSYVSSNEQILDVSESGKVTAVSDGTAFITISNLLASTTVKVHVLKSENYIRLSTTAISVVRYGEGTVTAEVVKNGKVSDDRATFTSQSQNLQLRQNGNTVTIYSDTTGYYSAVASFQEMTAEITVKVVNENAQFLDNPVLSVENCETLKWDEVENAEGYKVMINGGSWIDVEGVSYNIGEYTSDLKDGENVVFAVRAVANENFDCIDGLPERLVFAHNFEQTTLEPFTCAKEGKVRHNCQTCGKTYDTENYLTPHQIKDGACEVCGIIITERVMYLYDSDNECYYVAGADAGFDAENVYILAKFNDGKNGEHPVKYFGCAAFQHNNTIKRVYVPESITEFVDAREEFNVITKENGEKVSSPLRGLAFDGCSNLEFVSIAGMTYLPAVDNGDLPYHHDNFRDCYNLTRIIVGEGFYNAGRNWMKWINSPSDALSKTDIYVYGDFVNGIATDDYPIGSETGANNNLLTGKVFYYSETSSACFTWHYDNNGEVASNGTHEYKNGVCVKCGSYYNYEIAYAYDDVNNCYYVDNNKMLNVEEVIILSEFNDGIHGVRPVSYIRNGAFEANQTIKKVILPESVTTLDGSVFQNCTKLEYVSMVGVSDMIFQNIVRPYGAVTTNNNFLGCYALKVVIVGKNFNLYADSTDAQQFYGIDEFTPYADIFVDAKKSESNVSCAPNGKNNILTGKVYYKGNATKCMEWNYDASDNIVYSTRAHNYVDNICEHCGSYETHGVNYVYDSSNDVYYVSSYTGSATEVTVLSSYNDGANGKKAVAYIAHGAFQDNVNITKVILPESITDLDGSVFAGCTNLRYISMIGVKALTYGETTRPYGTRYGNNNFMNCVSLETVIVSNQFSSNVAQFGLHGTTAERVVRIFVNGASGAPSLQDDALLTGLVYYKGDATKCFEWSYDGSDIVHGASVHSFADGKCDACGKIQTDGIAYAYDSTAEVYYVDGYTGSDREVYVLSSYNDGTNGEKSVAYIAHGAFQDNVNITKVVLPESITDLDGNVFWGCTNLSYVSMIGVKALNYGETARPYGTRYGNNNFMNCVNLETVIVSNQFSSNVQQFGLHGEVAERVVRIFVNGAFGAPSLQDDVLLTDKVYFYSETQAQDAWHYIDGVATLWA